MAEEAPPLMLPGPPGAHCALAVPWDIPFQPGFFHNIQKHWEMVIVLEHNNPQTF